MLHQPEEQLFQDAIQLSELQDLCMVDYTTINHGLVSAFVETWHS